MALAELLKLTTEVGVKLVPLTVRAKLELPAAVEVGDMELVVGMGLFIVKTCELEAPPPGVGLITVIVEVPAEVISADVIVAVN